MSRKFIAAVALSALMAASFGAAPARADDRDTIRAIAGIGALLLLGKVIHDNKKDRRKEQVYHNNRPAKLGHGYQRPHHVKPRPLPQRVRKMTLPRHCLKTVKTRGYKTRFMGQRCLQNNYRWAGQLPRACTVKVRGNRGMRYGYEPRCLKQHGYRLNG